jgi:KipI family sensor histidine kinase inhibitor
VTRPRIWEAGDSALLLELDETIDTAVNARAIAIAATVRRDAVVGVRDVVSTYRSVAVHFDPLTVNIEAMQAAIERAADSAPADVAGTQIEVPVQYGGDAAPDLQEVAEFAGMSVDETIDLHAGTPYRVFMLGFLPGFAYMGPVDSRIAMPRRVSPRVRVPAGAVAIAGQQTGIYPRESPGGWRLIGRAGVRVFDAARPNPSLFAAGDVVRFVPTATLEWASAGSQLSPSSTLETPHERTFTVLRPGLFTTIQDAGRWGHQSEGVPVGGALDLVSHRVANALVDNESDAATLEVTLLGPEIRLEFDTVIAIAGADLGAQLDSRDVRLNTPTACRAGSVLRFVERRSGTRAYVAFDGGIDVPPVFGSRATSVVCGLGGIDGRALIAGDRVSLGRVRRSRSLDGLAGERRVDVGRGARLRVLPGPQRDFFPEEALERLCQAAFIVSPRSDRMGYRLEGARLARVERREMISDAAFAGGIQVPPSGDPILLMADRQTTGGYPQIATVITADLPLAGQLGPGDRIEFAICTRREAIAALVEQEAQLRALR